MKLKAPFYYFRKEYGLSVKAMAELLNLSARAILDLDVGKQRTLKDQQILALKSIIKHKAELIELLEKQLSYGNGIVLSEYMAGRTSRAVFQLINFEKELRRLK